MKFLLDTNLLIRLEPTSSGDVEVGMERALRLVRLLQEGGHRIYRHPVSDREVLGDRNTDRADLRSRLVQRYSSLEAVPLHHRWVEVHGTPNPGSHNENDALIASSVLALAVDYLVTEDRGLRRKLNVCSSVTQAFSVDEALAFLDDGSPGAMREYPKVELVRAYLLDERDPLFDSLRSDYTPAEFDPWLAKCKQQHRPTLLLRGESGALAALAILNDESRQNEFGWTGSVWKICLFKVADAGLRLGELLLKATFDFLYSRNADCAFVEFKANHPEVGDFLERFGFVLQPHANQKGDRVCVKRFQPEPDSDALDPLELHRLYGPRHYRRDGVQHLLVPIQPQYHALLFPELEVQQHLWDAARPFGNAIRKAYLCKAVLREVLPGDIIYFYRSRLNPGVQAIGVVEESFQSQSADHILAQVRDRTVYTRAEIESMCTVPVRTILFRHARILQRPVCYHQMRHSGLINGAPQSITRLEASRAIAQFD